MIHVPSFVNEVLEAISGPMTPAEIELFTSDKTREDRQRRSELINTVATTDILPEHEGINLHSYVTDAGQDNIPDVLLAWGYRSGSSIQAGKRLAAKRRIEFTFWNRNDDSDLLHLYYYRALNFLIPNNNVGDIDPVVSEFIFQNTITLLMRFTFELQR